MRGTGSAQICLFSGAKYRLGYDETRWRFVYNLIGSHKRNRYSASLKFDLLEPLGIQETKYELYYKIHESSKQYVENWLTQQGLPNQEWICVSPGSPVKKKKWDLDNYAGLLDRIQGELKKKVVLLWGPGEEKDVETIQTSCKIKPIIALPTNYNQAAAILTYCELLICNDGSINHLSVATKTPALSLFGNTNPRKLGTYNLPTS